MSKIKKFFYRLALFLGLKILPLIKPGYGTRWSIFIYRRLGMNLQGRPNYISSRINFDGTDYSLIEINEGVTISSFVRVLTHDWSLYTVSKSLGYYSEKPIGKIKGVSIGAYSFVGTGSIIMPGARIGRGCIIGAGTVVRGKIPDYSVVAGSPCEIIGDTRKFIEDQFEMLGLDTAKIESYFDKKY